MGSQSWLRTGSGFHSTDSFLVFSYDNIAGKITFRSWYKGLVVSRVCLVQGLSVYHLSGFDMSIHFHTAPGEYFCWNNFYFSSINTPEILLFMGLSSFKYRIVFAKIFDYENRLRAIRHSACQHIFANISENSNQIRKYFKMLIWDQGLCEEKKWESNMSWDGPWSNLIAFHKYFSVTQN
jgi:hypothetical protein